MNLLADRPAKAKIDTTAETAATQAFNRKARLIRRLEALKNEPSPVGVIEALTQFIGDAYITHLVTRVLAECE